MLVLLVAGILVSGKNWIRVVRNHVDGISCIVDSSYNSNTNQQYGYQHVGFIALSLVIYSLWRLDIVVRTYIAVPHL